MSRRRRAEIRKILPDPRHNSVDLAKFINNVMMNGKKTVAQRIVYSALDLCESEAGRSGFEIFEQAIVAGYSQLCVQVVVKHTVWYTEERNKLSFPPSNMIVVETEVVLLSIFVFFYHDWLVPRRQSNTWGNCCSDTRIENALL